LWTGREDDRSAACDMRTAYRSGAGPRQRLPALSIAAITRHAGRVAQVGRARVDGCDDTFRTIQQGAATSVLVAASPTLEGLGGRYSQDCNEAEVIAPD
jgi:hypothetical protein